LDKGSFFVEFKDELFKTEYYQLGILNDETTIKRLVELDMVENDLIYSMSLVTDISLGEKFLYKLKSIPLISKWMTQVR
jgi:hypothetical protein